MSSFVLKLIAIFSMLLDHTLKILPSQLFLMEYFGMSIDASYSLLHILEPFRRLAFPIFAFLIAEGCRHTSSPKRYLGRLLVFGLISELPFRLANGIPVKFPFVGFRNVFFTLALGALSCFLYRLLRKKGHPVLAFLPVLPLAVLAEPLHTDYGGLGVLVIFAAFIFPSRKLSLPAMGVILTVLYLGTASWNGLTFMWFQSPTYLLNWTFALLALVLLAFYNGLRGKRLKWTFYVFYPAHLLLLYGCGLLIRSSLQLM